MSRKAEPLALSEDDHWKFRRVVEAKYVSARVELRARILLGAAAGISNHDLARQFSVSRPTVMKWRRHYEKHGMDGLLVSRAPSGERRAALRQELEILNFTLGTYPIFALGLSWTVHEVARQLHIRRDTVQRTWKTYKIRRHMLEGVRAEWDFESLILSSDPLLGARIVAMAGLFYLTCDPALALVVDPREPWVEPECLDGDLFEPGAAEELGAALHALDGVLVWGRQGAEDLLAYLNGLEEKVSAEYDIHLVMRLYRSGVHCETAVQEWLAGHTRFWPHFMPMKMWDWWRYAERWLELIKASERKTPVVGMKEIAAQVKEWVAEDRKMIEGPLYVR